MSRLLGRCELVFDYIFDENKWIWRTDVWEYIWWEYIWWEYIWRTDVCRWQCVTAVYLWTLRHCGWLFWKMKEASEWAMGLWAWWMALTIWWVSGFYWRIGGSVRQRCKWTLQHCGWLFWEMRQSGLWLHSEWLWLCLMSTKWTLLTCVGGSGVLVNTATLRLAV